MLSEKLPPTYDELIAESAQTDREQVRRAFDQLHATLLLGAPARAKLPKRIPRADFPASRPWHGARARRHRNWPLDRTRFSVEASEVQLVQVGHPGRALVCLMRVPYAYFRGRRTLW